MKYYLQPSLQDQPCQIILYTGTMDLGDLSPGLVAEKLLTCETYFLSLPQTPISQFLSLETKLSQ